MYAIPKGRDAVAPCDPAAAPRHLVADWRGASSPRINSARCLSHCFLAGPALCRGFLIGEVARQVYERLLAQHRVLRQHPVEIGTEPVGQIIGLDRAAEPPRMKATGNSVTDLDPR